MRQNFVAQFVQLLKCWSCGVWFSTVTQKNRVLLVDQLQVLQFSVHHINLLSMFLRCDRFTGIQKAVVDQTGSRLPVTMTFSWCKFALGSALELLLSPATEMVIAGCCMKSTFHCMSQSNLDMVHCCCIE